MNDTIVIGLIAAATIALVIIAIVKCYLPWLG